MRTGPGTEVHEIDDIQGLRTVASVEQTGHYQHFAFVSGWLERIEDRRFHTAELDVEISGTCPAVADLCGTSAHHELEYAGSGESLFLFGEAEGELELDGRPYRVHQSVAFTGENDGPNACLDGIGSALAFVVAAE